MRDFPLADIIVEERQREDYGDIGSLAQSINKDGQLQPIVVDRTNRLIYGGRRFAALLHLKRQTGWVEYTDVTDPIALQEMELVENVQRKALEPMEEQRAIAKIDALRHQQDPNWTVDKTAKMLNVSRRTVFNAKEITAALDKFEAGDKKYADVASAETSSGAMLRLAKIKDIESRKVAAIAREQDAHRDGVERKWDIVTGDAVAWLESQPDESLDVLITNPPYGVDIEEMYMTKKEIYGGDDPVTMSELARQIVNLAARKLKPDRWLAIFWPTSFLEDMKGIGESMQERIRLALIAGGLDESEAKLVMSHLKPTLNGFLATAGFKFQRVPGVWYKNEGKYLSSISDPYAMLNLQYETFFLARKGSAKFQTTPTHGNVFPFASVPSAERIHPLQMPAALWSDILRLIAQPGERVVEVCSGSGEGGLAALSMGCSYVGIELDEEKAARSRMLLSEGKTGLSEFTVTVEPAVPQEVPFDD